LFRDSVEVTAATVKEATDLALKHLGVTDARDIDVEVLDEGVAEGQFTWDSRPARVRATKRVENFGYVSQHFPESIPVPVEDVVVRGKVPNDTEAPRSRRRTRRTSRPTPRPTLVLGQEEEKPQVEESVAAMGIEPSRARERSAYEPSEADSLAVEDVTTAVLDAADLEYEAEFEPGDYQRVFITLPPRRAGVLIGRRGAALDALEHVLGRMASQKVGHMVPVQVDVNEYRERHEEEMREEALEMAQRVLDSGKDHHFSPMRPRDRRVIHLAVKPIDGLETYTLGEGADRHVVIVRED
jgi:spoIIIJ-associated protein